MHICYIVSEYPFINKSFGGVGTMVKTLAEKLVENEIRVSVIGFYEVKELTHEVFNGVDIYRIPRPSKSKFNFISNVILLNKYVKNLNIKYPIDIIEGSEQFLAFLKKEKSIKYVIRMHGGSHFFPLFENIKRSRWKMFVEKLSFGKADALLAVSEFVGFITKREIKFKQEYKVIYNSVDAQKFKPNNLVPVVSQKIIFVGTVCEKKGIRYLIKAMPKVLDRFPEAQLQVVGRDWFYPDKRSYTEMLKQEIPLECKGKIEFTGAVPNDKVPEMLASAEIVVFPSLMEAHPMAWLEAMSMGKPFIGSKTGPGPEVVMDNENGLLADPYDPNDIADKIIYLFNNRQIANDFGREARNLVIEKFEINKIIKVNMDFYSSLIFEKNLI